MLNINPGEYLPIERQLADPTDSTTRYVRAYIRKKKGNSEELLATLDLTDEGGQRFTYYYQAPQDSDPYYLTVVTKVFDNSGYTTESTRYTREHQTYLVAERWGLMYGRGGGGADISYDKVRNIVKEEIGKVPRVKVPPFPKIPEVNLSLLLRALEEVNRNIRSIRIPEPERIDFGPVTKAIENVQREVRAIKIPEPEKVDLSPALKAITNLGEVISQFIKTDKDDIKEAFESLRSEFKKVTFVRLKTEEESGSSKKRRFL